MDSSRFIELVLDLHNKYGSALGISDVYAYSALGRVIKAVGTVIISPNSPMLLSKTPRTISMYLLSNGSVIALADLPIDVANLRDCSGERVEVTNDLYKPPSTLTAINMTKCQDPIFRVVKDVGRKYGVNLEVWFTSELGMEGVKVVYRGGFKDLKHLARVVIVMTALTNIRGNNDVEAVLKLISDLMRRY
ncbi:hypothetical protein [Vulcanisaeta distributa]|uniref:Uncharacterized protein n=1 Tax=Vulcanisaeta distributa (strain DSM 14429 / JCM 11212 / NBRC 100878 / IC-017) TaxID=572478 RepID=E1QQF1_VULDI|nr:hypothetical protein [Vulcanisaeta distributa]ADN50446.1 hypothetical protein Vdis_1058 [Vulcanisaeta distributa DSM 14429]